MVLHQFNPRPFSFLTTESLLDGDGAASRGNRKVLHHGIAHFSPLLDGDGAASVAMGSRVRVGFGISVPFLTGMVLHLDTSLDSWSTIHNFSPLLDGDGAASPG